MCLFQKNKKSELKSFLTTVIIAILGFLVIVALIEIFKGAAEAGAAESICRTSVALREKTYFEKTIQGGKVGAVASPLICRTIDKYIPADKNAGKQQVEKEFAELMTSCWKMFGEGKIQDVFKQGDPLDQNCFVCYNVNLRETPQFKGENAKIPANEFFQYLFATPYKAYSSSDNCKPNGGFCADVDSSLGCADRISADSSYLLIDKKNDVCQTKNKKACCYTEYECWNRGGICSKESPDSTGIVFKLYDKWDCPAKMDCYIKAEDHLSYGDYIQKYGGEGRALVLGDIKPGETYAVSFGSTNTHSCGWCTKAALGAGVVFGGGVLILTPLGWTIAGIAAVAGGVGTKMLTENYAVDIASIFREREVNTIYLSTLNTVREENRCNVIKDIREK